MSARQPLRLILRQYHTPDLLCIRGAATSLSAGILDSLCVEQHPLNVKTKQQNASQCHYSRCFGSQNCNKVFQVLVSIVESKCIHHHVRFD